MKIHRLIVTCAAGALLLASAVCQAEEGSKPSAASRLSSKARDYATRPDKEAPPDVAATSGSGTSGQKEADKLPALDTQAVDKAAKDTGDNWKKLDKILDRF